MAMTTETQDHVRALRDMLDEIDVRIEVLLDSPYAAITYDTGKDLQAVQALIAEVLRATGGAT
jgi:hypothetical protein